MQFRVRASRYDYDVSAQVADLATAQKLAARFPKSAGVKATTLSTFVKDADGNPVPDPVTGCQYQHITLGLVYVQGKLSADGINGGRNEAGIKRFRSFERAAAKLGHSVTYSTSNPHDLTADQFAQAMA